ncbi:glycoside hydrolase family 6 protein [Streptomyces sp. NBC_00249]|uniref:glycoside hydrolase family 6 protein n=1 Tax=Streptomyces sp. NBC_00249 TaxID=2975690 RepID=UPI002251D682|nr:glycoside hydrolase family 6 protein [Streptomyces sp. NBC_00249]MCX5194315.1 glycoside hydrolase family 6 protein [Streptomyces sp. NBC_00249]
MPPAARRRRPVTVLGLLLLLACAPACSPGPVPAPAPRPGPSGGVAEADGSPFWVDPQGVAARQVAAWEAQGRYHDAQVLRRISERPTALWVRGGDPGPEIRRARAGAKAAGRTVLLTAHRLPYRGCAPHPSGGARDAAAYRAWTAAFAAAVADAPALVVLEPDALAHTLDGCTPADRQDERYRLLSEAVDRLKRNPHTRVYLDAGDPARIPDPARLVDPLRRAGLAHADGFALNVSGHQDDAAARAYGARLSKAVGGKHFVLDTGPGGAGPAPGGGQDPAPCNPPGRSLGTPPTDRTGDPLVDAYLWIRTPGTSDGPCRGGPAAGEWWPEHALGLARRALD